MSPVHESHPATLAHVHAVTGSAVSTQRRTISGEFTFAFGAVLDRWRRRGIIGFPWTVVSSVLVFALWEARIRPDTKAFVDRISAVRLTQPIFMILERTPLSLFAPTFRLPVTGALLQVLIVVAIAEVHLGALRTGVIALGTQLGVNLVVLLLLHGGQLSLLGVARDHLSDRDTGPSVAVIAVALATGIVARTYILAVLLSFVMIGATFVLPDRAGREHIAALVMGALFGLVLTLGDRHRSKPTGVGFRTP